MKEMVAVFAGGIIGFYLFSMVFTIGEFVFGLILGFKFRYFSFLGLNILRENGKICVRKTNFAYLPFIAMVYGDNEEDIGYTRDLIKYILKSVTLIVTIVIVYLCCSSLSGIYHMAYLMVVTELIIGTIIVIIKYFDFVIKAFGKGPKSEIFREVRSVHSQLRQGVTPGKLRFSDKIPNHKIFDSREPDYWGYDMIRYYWAVENNQMSMMKMIFISAMENQVDYDMKRKTRDVIRQNFYYELIYYYSAIETDIQKAEKFMNYAGSNLEKDKDINGRRVYSAYLYYTGKGRELALEAAQSGLEVFGQSHEKGLALFERDLINQLIEKIKGEWDYANG